MSTVILSLFFVVVVLAMVWIGAGMILRQWEGSRWRRRWRTRIQDEWTRAEKLVREEGEDDPAEEEDRAPH